jgi:hypothetical protein
MRSDFQSHFSHHELHTVSFLTVNFTSYEKMTSVPSVTGCGDRLCDTAIMRWGLHVFSTGCFGSYGSS